jgi:hypothetical protein
MNIKRLSRGKILRTLSLIEKIRGESKEPTLKEYQNLAVTVEKLIYIIDDVQTENEYLQEEIEKVKFDLEDKKYEKRRGRGNGQTFQF